MIVERMAGAPRRATALAAALVAPLLACAAAPVPLARMAPECAFTLVGNRMLCDGAPYAEIVVRDCVHGPEAAFGAPRWRSCRGVGVRYADRSRVTLYAAPHSDPWGESDGLPSPSSKAAGCRGPARDVVVDAAARRITIRTHCLFGSPRLTYDVATGVLSEGE